MEGKFSKFSASTKPRVGRLLRRMGRCAMLLLVGVGSLSFIPVPAPPAAIDFIVIDAGHGGKDPGTNGRAAREKDVALSVALRVEKLFRDNKTGIAVELTRKGDSFVELVDRAAFANKRKADLFISIHCNANPNKYVVGSETYAMGLHKNDDHLDVMMRENSTILMEDNYQEKYDGFDPKSPEAYIVFSLVQNAYLRQSLALASKIEYSFKANTKRQSRGVKQAGFLVLWKTAMPSVLAEIGFLSNPVEEKFLASAEGQQHVANAIYQAVLQYRQDQGAKTGGTPPAGSGTNNGGGNGSNGQRSGTDSAGRKK
jgi:N-acetylmuramoyl-L-alanine amidase